MAIVPLLKPIQQRRNLFLKKKYNRLENHSNSFGIKLTTSKKEIEKALKLRFNVFNLEMGEGLESSYLTQKDEDEFDKQCHHLIIINKQNDGVVGTYRLQHYKMARNGIGFYSDTEFNLSMLGEDTLEKSVELGRSCIAKEYRSNRVLFLLWRGIANYLIFNKKRYLFGCCSLNSQDPVEGITLYERLKEEGYVDESFCIAPRENYALPEGIRPNQNLQIEMPSLMRMYLKYGAKVIGTPAIDREFKTIDYFILFDLKSLDPEIFKNYLGRK
jgi:putative hemolysin